MNAERMVWGESENISIHYVPVQPCFQKNPHLTVCMGADYHLSERLHPCVDLSEDTEPIEFLFIRVNHNTGCSAAMSSGTQYMLQKESLYTVAVAYIWYLDSTREKWQGCQQKLLSMKFRLQSRQGQTTAER